MGLAFGLPESALMFRRHIVPVGPVLALLTGLARLSEL